MGIWSNMMAAVGGETRSRDPGDEFWWSADPTATDAQIVVNYETILQIPEVYTALQVLAQTVAALPLVTYQKKSDGSRERASNHPVADLLHDQPNDTDTAYEWRFQMTWDMALHRNAYAEIIPGPRGPIGSLERIDPEMVKAIKLEDGSRAYDVHDETGRVRRLDPSRIFHLRVGPMVSNGLIGRPIIRDSWHIFAHALAVQDFGRRFFENGATPGGFLTSPDFKKPEQKKEWARKWQRFFTGNKRFKVAVLDGDAKYIEANIPNDKAQFNETANAMALKVLRLWRMPPHKAGILDSSNRSTNEQQALEFVTDVLFPWLVAWEQAIKRDLMMRKGYYAEHNVAGLLRGDLKSRYEAYAIGRQWGFLSVNDIRSLENKNKIKDGDTYLEPMNMTPVGSEREELQPESKPKSPPGRNNEHLSVKDLVNGAS